MQVQRAVCVFVLASLVAGHSFGADGDWAQWRGPNRDGISAETGLKKDWKSSPPKLLWQVEGLGKGYASVAIADGRLYTTGRHKSGESLMAFDLAKGKQLWSTPFGKGGSPQGSPTVDGDRVYSIGKNGDLVCCNTAGKVLWKKNFAKDFGGKMMSGWGYAESPLIDGDKLLCTPGAKNAMIVALDKMTGKEIWRSSVPDLGKKGKDGAGYSSIVVSEGAGVRQYVQLAGRALIGVRASDGKHLWHYGKTNNGTANIPTPIVSGDYVFSSSGYGTGAALVKLSKSGSGVSAKEVYFLKSDVFQNHHGGMILIGDYIYSGHKHNNGFPICIEMKTGKVKWGGDFRGPGGGSAAIVSADGHLVFRYQDGIVALIEASPAGYKLKGSFKPVFQQGKSWAHPVIHKGRLYLREQNKLMCYDISAS